MIPIWPGVCPSDVFPEDIDVAITGPNSYTSMDLLRRHIVVHDIEAVPQSIRKAVQEGAPRPIDMFLPIFGLEHFDNKALQNIDPKSYQGVILLDTDKIPRFQTLNQLIAAMSEHVLAIGALESVYVRYRSLCDAFVSKFQIETFIRLALADGVLFDVRKTAS